jgi:exopolysaccharide biosynthesis polyprenyl glycosylphosphotransferase
MAFVLILAGADAVAIAVAYIAAYYFRFAFIPLAPGIGQPPLAPYLYPLPVVVGLWLIILKALGLYDRHRTRLSGNAVIALLISVLLGAVLLSAGGFVYRGFSYSRLVVLTTAAFAFVALGVARALVLAVRGALLRRGVGAKRALVVGSSPAALELCRRLASMPASDYYLVGVIPADGDDVPPEFPVLGRLGDFFDVVGRENVAVVFLSGSLPEPVLLDLLLESDLRGLEVRLIPSVVELVASRMYADDALGVPVFALRHFRLTGFNRLLKRTVDVAFAATVLGLSAPFFGLIAALVKLTSPGPLFYKQERVGQDGRTFSLLKFRSMRPDAEAETGPVFATRGDARVTPFGRFLRRMSLDELPQFLNVLKGDMSVVGPRPERPFFVEKFASDIPRYLERHKVKSGMTGWAQVNGFRGNTSIARRVEFDLYYIENWSLVFDLRIIVRTVSQLVKGAGH